MKRLIEADNSDEDGIGSVRRKQIWHRWNQNKSAKQIADETGESVETVYRSLANGQKAIIERIGVESYGRKT
jgi:butyrate kinase